MSIKRNMGIIALLGGSTAALAMMTGIAGARADDLQVNQQLLSERLDQLAAVGLQPGAGAYLGVEQNKAAGAPVVGGSFPRSILIPGTETSFKIYGEIAHVMDYFMSGGPPNGYPSPTIGTNGQVQSIALNGTAHARSNGIFQMTEKQSKIGFETRTPTAFGEARTVMEFDWNNGNGFLPGGGSPQAISDNLAPRFRYGYGTLGGLLAGQATSNFSDPDANSESLDFGGNVGAPGHVRVPQIRYTMPAYWGGSLSVSAEAPATSVGGPGGLYGSDAGGTAANVFGSGPFATNITKSTAPDLTAAYYIPQPWGHLDFSAVLLPGLNVDDGKYFSKTYIGYGGHFGMSFQPGWMGWSKDTFNFHIVAGEAIGPFLNSSTNFALATNYNGTQTTAASAASLIFKPTKEIGGEIGYQHWWADNLRSNINFGINHHDIPAQVVGCAYSQIPSSTGGCALNKELMTAHANVIWNPVSFVTIGLEYMWGQRRVVSNLSATENVLVSKFAFKF